MEEWRAHKVHGNNLAYKETYRIIRQKIKIAKECWLVEHSKEMEELQEKGDTFGLHKKAKEITHI